MLQLYPYLSKWLSRQIWDHSFREKDGEEAFKIKRTELASMINYPINVHIMEDQVEIKNSTNLLKHYDQIFTQEFKKRIACCVPHNMFCKYTGVMLGSGEIWFGADGKVIAINNLSE